VVYDNECCGSIPWTPLQCVCACQVVETVRFLLDRGADYTVQDETGRNALEIARHLKFDNIVHILEQHIDFSSKSTTHSPVSIEDFRKSLLDQKTSELDGFLKKYAINKQRDELGCYWSFTDYYVL
jgi:ankyrin repeat protein